jgi:serine/threonine-protein kinase
MGKLFRWTLLFVVLIIFASGAVAVYTVFFSAADEVTVPALRDMSLLDASSVLERLGLEAKVVKVPSTLPQGRILVQSPEAGVKTRRDRVVVLQISQGGPMRPVPDVRNLDAIRAQDAIREQGFEIGDVIRIKDDSQPVGTVIAQSPAAPANIPSDSKIDLLVNQGGEGRVVVPDVARMTERQARDLLASNSLRIARAEYVYSLNEPDGSVMGTRPAAGTAARAGDSVLLRVATSKKPETPATSRPAGAQPSEFTGEGRASSQVVVQVPGQEDVIIRDTENNRSDGGAGASAVDPGVSVFDRQGARVIRNPSLPGAGAAPSGTTGNLAPIAVTPLPETQTGPQTTPRVPPQPGLQPTGGKIARIRYQVPPLARPLALKIEMVDPSGTRVLLNRDAKSGEYVSLDAPYSKECAVTIYLGGEFVWQDKYM